MPVAKQIEKILFEAARELNDPQLRAAFLDQACHGQPVLKNRLEKLLSVQQPSDDFFRALPLREVRINGAAETPAVPQLCSPTVAKTVEGVSAVVGQYRLLERLGEGGCGVVYLAEQDKPIRRRVALKIIRLGMDTENVIKRFEAERQALALMDHPNIARALDAGATESGRPYFVMELVEGIKITDFCNSNQLDVKQRLRLFMQVCHAIQHAHQKGIIHRDIKPSNILVTEQDGKPVPKVIDFGIAKAIEGRLTDNTIFTAYEQFIGTPAYMSPEQADVTGIDIDTRSDIYSLGVLLYEMLTGQTPFDSKELLNSGMDQMRRTLRESEPKPPSTLLTTLGHTKLEILAAYHHSEPPRLISTVRGDLDWIVMKALEKDRSRRYETANGLALEVQRYLNNEPISARPPSRVYRLRKLVLRNRGVSVAIAAIAVVFLTGGSVSTVLYFKELESRREAVAAEHQQIVLRKESDQLRQQAEFRQKLSEAALARSLGKLDEADRLVAGIPAPAPKIEYSDMYRDLGDWDAQSNRWQRAAERFGTLTKVNQPDDWDITTLDYLRYGPALLEAREQGRYEEFRRSAVAHFSGTTNPVPAERILKVSLLLPPDTNLLAQLQPLREVASNSVLNADSAAAETNPGDASLVAWRAFSLELMAYRCRDYSGVDYWYQKSLKYQNVPGIRLVTLQIVLAMSHYRTGKTEQARAELAELRPKIEDWLKGDHSTTGDMGFWFDWAFAHILLREASSIMDGTR